MDAMPWVKYFYSKKKKKRKEKKRKKNKEVSLHFFSS
jgi:hypothetical protein